MSSIMSIAALPRAPACHAGSGLPRTAARRRFADFLAITKPRMNALVVATTAVGYYLAQRGACEWPRLAATLIGTALAAAGASALNQVIERDFDALMPRTADRPLPAGRLRPIEVWLFGAGLCVVGIAVLSLFVNLLTALLALTTVVTYVWLYT